MTGTVLIEKVREEFGTLEVPVEKVMAFAKKILERAQTETTRQQPEEKFISRNITLKEYVTLSLERKAQYQGDAETLNKQWIDNQLASLGAKWIMVVDGRVVRHGATLQHFPNHEELIALCQSTGKYPFAFFSSRVFAIEEINTSWHKTKDLGDVYPAVSIAVLGNQSRFETEADLDTGAVECYAGFELLSANNIVKVHNEDLAWASKHLGQPFFYFALPIKLELSNDAGERRQCQTTVLCVIDWWHSPFIAINPTRTFLLGRSVLFELRPRLVLDFDVRSTEVQFKTASS